MIVPVDQERFAQACRWAEEHVTPGVGGLGEKTTHRALKYYFLPRESCHEQKIGGFVADGLGDEGVLEIQSRNLYTLLPKLEAFLPEYPVTVVYPVVVQAQILWLDPDTGEEAGAGKRSRRCGVNGVLPQLYGLRKLLSHPNLRIAAVTLTQRQLRLLDGRGKDKKIHATKLDNLPLSAGEILWLDTPEDYAQLLPDSLPEEFSAQTLAKSMGLPQKDGTSLAGVYGALGLLQGQFQGRRRVWRRAAVPPNSVRNKQEKA